MISLFVMNYSIIWASCNVNLITNPVKFTVKNRANKNIKIQI